ncbi:hypothetical protein N8I77_010840 [Diaporthe amygdali]|uniref:Uncharacterized protein n=1 Tax=Phomopsis amygdali TaxID=1214568 RepID=A0AAD9S827_PHOAM|nr:hypothetical protein N8I77_010840 [Diaporthe amygdali]
MLESWVKEPNDTNPPASSDISKPRAVESKRFPGNYIDITWNNGAKMAQTDPIHKRLCDFVVLLFADRTSNPGNLHLRRTIMSGAHTETLGGSTAVAQGRQAHLDGEHVTGRFSSKDNERRFHGYIIYPQGVPLGGSQQAKNIRASNSSLTTADAVFACRKDKKTNPNLEFDPVLNEALGSEILLWFRTEFTKPERAMDKTARVLVYDPKTRSVSVYKEGSDENSAPEHTFKNPCKLPAEKLGMATSGPGATPGGAGPSNSGGTAGAGGSPNKPSSTGNKAPSAGNKAPAAGNKAPAARNKAPAAGNKAPAAGNKPGAARPSNSGGAAGAGGSQNKPPSTGNKPPAAGNKPVAGNKPPSAALPPGVARPSNSGGEPGAGGSQNKPPSTGNKPPATGNKPPAAGNKPPSAAPPAKPAPKPNPNPQMPPAAGPST